MSALDQELDRELSEALRDRGQRVTLARLLVHRRVRGTRQHVTAEQVQSSLAADMPSLSPATVYATLDMLDELGLIRRISTPSGATVYDSRTDAHHHAICRNCGRIVDVDSRNTTSAAESAARASGFTVEHAEVQLTGLCADCAPSA